MSPVSASPVSAFAKETLGACSVAPCVCPFCGSVNQSPEGPCPRCTMEDTPAGRKATKARIGPWYVLQKRNPAAPGMKFETLLSFVRRGRVKSTSIVRGPTTHQFWRFASQVKGLSREFGVCYSCGSAVAKEATVCQQCNRMQGPPPNPDVFLETMDGDAAPVVYREIPVGNDALPESVVGASLVQPGPASEADEEFTFEAHEVEAAPEPAVEEHEIIVPALGAQVPHSAPADMPDEAATRGDIVVPMLGVAASPPAAVPAVTAAAPPAAPPAPARRVPASVEPPKLSAPPPPQTVAEASSGGAGDGEGDDVDDDGEDDYGDDQFDGEEDEFTEGEPAAANRAFVAPSRTLGPVPMRRFYIEGTIFVLVLVGALVSGLLFVDPQLQAQATAMLNRGRKWVGLAPPPITALPPAPPVAWISRTTPAPPPAAGHIAHDHPFPQAEAKTPPAPPEPIPVPPAAPPPNAVADQPKAGDQPLAATSRVLPPPVAEPAPPPAAAEAPVETPAPAPPPPVVEDDPFARARTLRRSAIDAENSGDYAKAVSLFEQIKELPREAWPGDLELRLKAAKANAAGAPRR